MNLEWYHYITVAAFKKQIESFGISFLRFNDLDVKKNVEGVVAAIEEWIDGYNL